ncbi:uncharacterized mitochondrial protein AtMg00810-like [Lycium ferocissimum]|uniref:uncharacterized mitochondrial protein AtMg00810-like n=1 Tax=Lycium ferocissimum TaxID=112874 RepID=UPI002815EC14|nr:uncharacterized mitochondrial protein AtMg00810-like [Lycium ferocissimum]
MAFRYAHILPVTIIGAIVITDCYSPVWHCLRWFHRETKLVVFTAYRKLCRNFHKIPESLKFEDEYYKSGDKWEGQGARFQRKYALQLIFDVGLSGAKSVSTPLELNLKLTKLEYDQEVGNTGDAKLEDITSYQKIVGKLLYLTITRPGICFGVQVLSQFMQHPKVSHWEDSLRMVRYIKKSAGLGVILRRGSVPQLFGYYDSDWAACPNTRRSFIGYVVKLGESLISRKSKKQPTVSRSSAEAK